MKQAERRLRGHRYKQPAFVEKDILQDPEFRADLEKIGRQLYLQRQVVGRESIAKAMFDTGLKVARSSGLLDSSASAAELADRRRRYAGEMRALNRRVRALRSLASARRSGILS